MARLAGEQKRPLIYDIVLWRAAGCFAEVIPSLWAADVSVKVDF